MFLWHNSSNCMHVLVAELVRLLASEFKLEIRCNTLKNELLAIYLIIVQVRRRISMLESTDVTINLLNFIVRV